MGAGTGERNIERALRVFISCRRTDMATARRLERASDADEGVEIYKLSSDETAGQGDWREAFRALIDAADAVLCLAGPTTSESANIAWELEEATKRDIPILVVGPTASALARTLEGHQVDTVEHAPPEKILTRLKELA